MVNTLAVTYEPVQRETATIYMDLNANTSTLASGPQLPLNSSIRHDGWTESITSVVPGQIVT